MNVSTIIIIALNLLLTGLFLLGVKKDTELNFQITISDLMQISMGVIINVTILNFYRESIIPMIFLSVGLSYLLIAAYMDQKCMSVFVFPGYVLLFIGIALESLLNGEFSFFIMFVFLLPITLGILNAFGRGDIPMCMVFAGAFYLYSMNLAESLIATCIMILIAEVFFIIKAVKEKNMKNPFCLKCKAPLGPSILLATYVMLIIPKL